MMKIEQITKGRTTAASRWARFGPYYAMFPLEFALEVVARHSKPGDWILDPFSGRGTSIFAGSLLGRYGTGIEINPLGWLYGTVKLSPAKKGAVLKRLTQIYEMSSQYAGVAALLKKDDAFFKMCYCDDVLKFLLAVRANLNWRGSKIDRTLMAFIMVHLHAKIGEGLSNQMRMTKSLGKQYSITWWQTKGLSKPPKINPLELMSQKIEWRYAKGLPEITKGEIKLADSCSVTKRMLTSSSSRNKYSLLFTSPPYCAITDYFADQWLRLWLLGYDSKPIRQDDIHKGRFNNKEQYIELLDIVFGNCAKMMKEENCVYVRTDMRDFTFATTKMIGS